MERSEEMLKEVYILFERIELRYSIVHATLLFC